MTEKGRPRAGARASTTFATAWRLVGATAAVTAACVVPPPAGASAATGRDYLEQAQNADGGFGAAPGTPSSVSMTGWAALGLAGAGVNPRDVRRRGSSAITYLRQNENHVTSTGDLERTILVLVGAGLDPRAFVGRDLVAELRRDESRDGSYHGQVNWTAFAVLARDAAGAPTPALARSAQWLAEAQNGDGSWGIAPDGMSESDSTAGAVQALAAASAHPRAVRRGVAFLHRAQRRDGGWPLVLGQTSNVQSTSWALQALVTTGRGSPQGRSYVSRLQQGDGRYVYSSSRTGSPVWVTGQALLALNEEPFPVSAVPRNRPRFLGEGADRELSRRRREASPRRRPADLLPSAKAAPSDGAFGAVGFDAAPGSSVAPESISAETAAWPRRGDHTTEYVSLGFAALVAGLIGGFFVYRRRLP